MEDDLMYRLDFNSLKALKVLGEEKNTKRTAERLAIGQPAVSKTLKKLRQQFDDPLFIMKQNRLEPTPKCEAILGQLPSVLRELEELFKDELSFDPLAYSGDIRIHINPVLNHPLSSILIERLCVWAPKSTLILEDWSESTQELLRQNQVDIGVSFFPISQSEGLFQEVVCSPHFKLCCRKGHPLVNKQPITLEDIAAASLVLATMPGISQNENYVETYLRRRGYIANVILRTDRMDMCSEILQLTDGIMPISEIVSPLMEQENLALLDVGHLDDVEHYPIAYTVSNRVKDSAYSQWLIQITKEIIDEIMALCIDPKNQYVYPTLTVEQINEENR